MRDSLLSLKTKYRLRDFLPTSLLPLACLLPLLVIESDPAHADSGKMTIELTTYEISPDNIPPNGESRDLSPDIPCPSVGDFRTEVTLLIGRDPFSAKKPAMRIEVKMQGAGNRYSGTLGSTGSASSRSFEATTCAELASTIALAVAIAIDPFFVHSPTEPAPEPDKPQPESPPKDAITIPEKAPVEPTSSTTDVDKRSVVHPTRSGVRFSASLQPSLSVGLTPTVSGGIAAGVGLHLGNASIEVSATATTRGQVKFPMGALDAQVFYLSLIPCWNPAKYSVCASMSIGAVRARGLAPLTERANILRVHSALGVRAYLPLLNTSKLRMRWFLEGQARVFRTTLVVESTQAWTTSAVFAQSGLEFSLN